MPIYLIIDVQISNKDSYSQYVQKAQVIVKKYGGKYLSRGAKITPLSGGWNPERIMVIAFDSKEQMDNCFGSMEYFDIVNLRKDCTSSRSIIVEGSID